MNRVTEKRRKNKKNKNKKMKRRGIKRIVSEKEDKREDYDSE